MSSEVDDEKEWDEQVETRLDVIEMRLAALEARPRGGRPRGAVAMLGDEMQRLRHEAKLSVRALAKKLKVSSTSVVDMEHGRTAIGPRRAKRIRAACKVKP